MAMVKRFRGLPTWLQIVLAAVVVVAVLSRLGVVQKMAKSRSETATV
jgi:hypothetical protein